MVENRKTALKMNDEIAQSRPLTAHERRIYVSEHIPTQIEKRVQPLRDLKCELQKLQNEYCRDLYELEKKYHEGAHAYYKKREQIINGTHEPNAEGDESKVHWEEQPDEVDLAAFADFYEKLEKLPSDNTVKGVPNFWLRIFTITDTISQFIHNSDIGALKYLTDVTIDYDIGSFTLEFHFKENPYFYNNVLIKQYLLENKFDAEHVLCGFDGLRIKNCTGCPIRWKRDKNLTLKLIINKNRGFKVVPLDSFFDFFDPPVIEPQNLAYVDDETREILNSHFKLGNFFREEIIPKAILYFTGEIVDNLDDEDEYNDGDLLENDGECADDFAVRRDDDKRSAHVARTLHKIHWN